MTVNRDAVVGGLLLAAGGSSRMGRPKQLVEFDGKTLLRRAAAALLNSACGPVAVVLGADVDAARNELTGLPVTVCVNKHWRDGMSSSIRSGLQALLKVKPDIAAVMITLCDQPFVTSDKIDLFITQFGRLKTAIIAAEYSGTVGVPALFSREMFHALMQLDGDKGARDLIRNRNDGIATIVVAEAARDLDSPDDLDKLKTN